MNIVWKLDQLKGAPASTVKNKEEQQQQKKMLGKVLQTSSNLCKV